MSDSNKLCYTNGKVNTKLYNLQNTKTSLENAINFPFQFVNESELKSALKKVRRANQRKRDEEKWLQFMKFRQERNNEDVLPEVALSAQDGSSCVECGRPELESQPYEETLSVGDEGAEDTNYQETGDNVSHTYQLGPALIKRLQDLLSTVRRMTSVLLNPTQHQFEDEDVDRTIKRSQEFDAMFARNHLYEIQRLLKGTKKLMVVKALNTVELEGKVSAALKCVTQALQVYTKHVSKGSRVKYQQVLPIFQSISAIESLTERLTGQRSFPLRKDIDVACSYMKQVLLEMSSAESKAVSVVSHSRRSQSQARAHQKHKPSSDLSMYSRRLRADWRRKSATLARARFGTPNKKYRRQSAKGSGKSERVVEHQDEVTKEPAPTKDVQHRNATRAVAEDKVPTMMEIIPPEPEDEELCLDSDTFLALKQLNSRASIKRNTDSQGNAAPDVLKTLNYRAMPSPSSPHSKSNSPRIEQSLMTADSSAVSAKSLVSEPKNVQLICLKESERKTKPTEGNQGVDTVETSKEEKVTTLTIEDVEKSEILEYHKKVAEYQKSCPHYKDGKAVGIVDRLANRILTEMVMDFQRNEMDQVIQILYNLEFQ